jgi:protein-S-isoprenylcysteine O-methyltransferase Ste14
MTWLRALLAVLVLPGTVAVYLPAWLIWRTGAAPPASWLSWRALAVVPALVALPIFASAVRDFAVVGRGTLAPVDPPKELVATGFYRWVRNPMYVGVVSWLAALAIFFASRPLALYAGLVWTGFHAFVVLYEEPALAARFGESYARYRRRAPRWLPRPPRADAPRQDGDLP